MRSIPRFHPLTTGLLLAVSVATVAPAYQNLRYEEDPADYQAPEQADFWDAAKYMALGETSYLSLGGQARLRGEAWNNFGYASGNDDTFLLLRLRLHGDMQVGSWLRVFVEGKSALSSERDLPGGYRTLDVDTLDLQNGFIDLKIPAGEAGLLTLRGGRQELQYGSQRLVSPLDWANTRRTFDGVRLLFKGEGGAVDAFWTQPVAVDKYAFNERVDGQEFYGAFATTVGLLAGWVSDLYYFGLDKDGAVFGEITGQEERHTLGARVKGAAGDSGFDLDLEGMAQFGDHADRDIEATALALQVGFKMPETVGTPRLYLGYDYASGDKNPDDDTLGTFNQLFPLGHAYLGYIDTVGRQNIIDFSQGMSMKASARTTVKLENHIFWRAEKADALYNAGGGVVRPGDPALSSEVGLNLDLTLKFALDRHTLLTGGYSHFFAGDFIKQSGSGEDIDFAYAAAQYTF